jgi:CRISPR-associated exonuclease Cas4
MFKDDELLPLSSLQHYSFCPRQCALIHIEGIWAENRYTAEGRIMHENIDTPGFITKNGVQVEKGVAIRSLDLGLVGKIDIVEFHHNTPYLVEYKRGRPKAESWDDIQLCAQALCLEEMLNINVLKGAIFYGKTRHRKHVIFSSELREKTISTIKNVHDLIKKGITPPAVYNALKCPRCSLFNPCLPFKSKMKKDVNNYLNKIKYSEY